MAPNKRAKKTGSIFQRTSDGRWVGMLDLPSPPGSRRRKTVTALTEAGAVAKLNQSRRDLEKDGDIPTANQTLASWLNVWFTSDVVKEVRPKTAASYRTTIEQYIIPAIGHKQLTKLTAADVRYLSTFIEAKELSPRTSVLAYQVLTMSLEAARRERRVSHNVADLVKRPRNTKPTLAVLTAADGIKVLQTVAGDAHATPTILPDRLASRWAAALLTGARQGELLGLELDRVGDDLDLSWQLQRLSWEHGCKTSCGKARGTECPDKKLTFPHDWEHRHLTGGLWLARPKSSAGWRVIPLVDPLRSIIEQRIEIAGTEPNPHGLLWTADQKATQARRGELAELDGKPIDPSWDNAEWHRVLKRAGVADARLHDARHTTASLLLEAGVSEPLIIKILGHSTFAMSRSYQHVNRKQLTDAMSSMSALMSPNG